MTCPSCGMALSPDARVCQRGHRQLGETWSAAAREASVLLASRQRGTRAGGLTREQDHSIERLAIAHGRTHVRGGYADKTARVTVPGGKHFHVHEDGRVEPKGFDHSVNWSQ